MGGTVVKLARVVGTVVSTVNVPAFDDRKLLVCDLLAPEGTPAGGYLIAVDTVGAGVGETVLLMDEGNSARQVLDARDAPIRTLVVGIVDHVEPGAAVASGAPRPPSAPPKATRRTRRRAAG